MLCSFYEIFRHLQTANSWNLKYFNVSTCGNVANQNGRNRDWTGELLYAVPNKKRKRKYSQKNVHKIDAIVKYSERVHLSFLHRYILNHPGQRLSTNQSISSLSRDQGQQQNLNDFNL